MANWKTTAIGLITAIAGFIAFAPDQFGGDNALVVNLCQYVTAGGFAALGFVARDS